MNDQQILAEFYKLRPDIDVNANDKTLIYTASPVSISSLSAAATRLESELLLAPAYKSAWDEYAFLNPDRSGIAFRREFLEKTRNKEIQLTAQREYDSLIKQFGENLRGTPIEKLREMGVRHDLIEKICRLLRNPEGGTWGGKYSDHDLSVFKKKAQFMSEADLTTRLEEVVYAQKTAKQNAGQIRQELEANRPALGKYHPYDTLPPITADNLKAILRSHRANEYLRRFGAIQLNDVLFGRR